MYEIEVVTHYYNSTVYKQYYAICICDHKTAEGMPLMIENCLGANARHSLLSPGVLKLLCGNVDNYMKTAGLFNTDQ